MHQRQGKGRECDDAQKEGKMLSLLPIDIKVKKKKVTENMGSEDLRSNLGCYQCECEQFLSLSVLIYEMQILLTCISRRTLTGAKLCESTLKTAESCINLSYLYFHFQATLWVLPLKLSHKILTLQDENIPMTSFIYSLQDSKQLTHAFLLKRQTSFY